MVSALKPHIELSIEDCALAARLIAQAGIAEGALMIPRADVERLVAWARRHGGRLALGTMVGDRTCQVCGCGDFSACGPEPCSWVDTYLCSACEPFVREIYRRAPA